MASEIRVNKIINRSGLSTVTFSDTGAIVSGIVTANSFSGNVTGAVTGSGANLTSIPAGQLTGTVADARLTTVSSSKLSGALPALDGSALTGINTAFGSGTSVNTSGIITATAFVPTQGQLSNRNIIINGGCLVAQRGSSSTTTSGYNVVDRFFTTASNFDQLAATISQDSESPDGFAKSLKWATTTPETTVDSNESLYIGYKFEGQDLQQLNYGGSSATEFTISFYVKTSITGTYSLTIFRDEPGTDRICTRTYTVPDTNWHRYTFTVAGDTSRVIQNDNSSRMRLMFHIAAGSDYTSSTSSTWVNYGSSYFAGGHATNGVVTTDNATFYLTGVQLEVGPVATPFEHRSYQDELMRCYRYFYAHSGQGVNGSTPNPAPDTNINNCSCQATTSVSYNIPLPVPMRVVPTLYSTVTGSTRYRVNSAGANTNSGSNPTINTVLSTHNMVSGAVAGFSGLVAGQAANVRRYLGTGILGFQAEL